MADLKAVYAVVDEQAALNAPNAFGERWDGKYPKISRSWRANWANLSRYFKYPQEVHRLIYTTNAIEGFNRQMRKVTRAKSVFPTDNSLLKNVVSGDDGHHKKVDEMAVGLGHDPRTVVHLLCRTHARITPPGPEVKGLCAAVRDAPMNGGLAAALDIHPRQRYTAHKAAVGQIRCRAQ